MFLQSFATSGLTDYLPSEDNPLIYVKDDDGSPDNVAFAQRMNLHFIDRPGYNYDRVRNQGEGYDWDDPPQ